MGRTLPDPWGCQTHGIIQACSSLWNFSLSINGACSSHHHLNKHCCQYRYSQPEAMLVENPDHPDRSIEHRNWAVTASVTENGNLLYFNSLADNIKINFKLDMAPVN